MAKKKNTKKRFVDMMRKHVVKGNVKAIKNLSEVDENISDEELMEQVKEIPPFTGNMAEDYMGILNKEMAALTDIWKDYKDAGNGNPLIMNHQTNIINMYTRLVGVAEAAKDPSVLDNILNAMKEVQKVTSEQEKTEE